MLKLLIISLCFSSGSNASTFETKETNKKLFNSTAIKRSFGTYWDSLPPINIHSEFRPGNQYNINSQTGRSND